jgi:hypothetical protein
VSESQAVPERVYRVLTTLAESQAAIDEVIATARQRVRLFDVSLEGRGFNAPARIERLRGLLAAGRAHRLEIALHETQEVERDCPRLVILARQFPLSIELRRTQGEARKASDPMLVADTRSAWHRMYSEHPRAIVALHSPADAVPLGQRFDEIWELSEPFALGRILGF